MDPNICLRKLRMLSKEAEDSETGEEGAELAQCFNDLDGWLSKQGFLPDAWEQGGVTTLHKEVITEGPVFASIRWSHPGYGSYVHAYWRKGEPDPFIDVNFAEGIRTIRESRILATLLKAAAATAEGWVAKPPWPT